MDLVDSYVMAKLTLHVPDPLIAAAKREAEARKTSVSKLVSDYFRVFAAAGTGGQVEGLPPVTASLVGCLDGADDSFDAYVDHLEKKHS
jgi:hypothetical protein